MSQTLIAPTTTNVIPSQRLAELLNMVWTGSPRPARLAVTRLRHPVLGEIIRERALTDPADLGRVLLDAAGLFEGPPDRLALDPLDVVPQVRGGESGALRCRSADHQHGGRADDRTG